MAQKPPFYHAWAVSDKLFSDCCGPYFTKTARLSLAAIILEIGPEKGEAFPQCTAAKPRKRWLRVVSGSWTIRAGRFRY